ncbi:LEAF RUST 10 DISEASE-RESISTANCE LOCUS RECEPTOR-LIKE PROTEIN KINASE-like 1.3 isoform X2 [Corylus avellana]|uniref:LEAF RUST 10 DISEASE-RESISTANCE LOCUS RECEPTOR-LIKE PROTEIN KINASE-like 1.3 isoform X2 n=1 Tax=Corylus avellana TaxID=13451 RepID=UPI00286A8109|nr:LEAF RUST 10 DISEASE-RESISTANCE LOCUS RECEPTOR-LIKE PROTEIN KINASE-like 1.3 isoform X2 [Corylus avellana]
MDSWLLSPSPFLISFYFLFFVTFVGIPGSLCDDDIDPTSCGKKFNCGEIKNIGFPFWEDTRPTNCGSPGLKLHCEGSVTTMEIMKVTYRVLDVNLTNQILKISREDFLTGICSLPPELVDTTLDPTLFHFRPGYQNITLDYGCPSSLLPFLGHFTCEVSGDVLMELGAQGPKECNGSVVVPVPNLLPPDVFFSSEILEQVIREGFEVEWKVDTAAYACPTCILSPSKSDSKGSNKAGLVIGVAVGTVGIAAVFLGCLVFAVRQRREKLANESQSKDLPTPPSSKAFPVSSTNFSRSTPPSYPSSKLDLERGSTYFGAHIFSYEELEEATNRFDPSRQLGDGGFGTVYYGELHDGRVVAVKRLYENNFKRVEQFMTEVEILTRLRHPNLVLLHGCTSKRSQELLLVYEYISNGTVSDHLNGNRSSSALMTWPVRLSIAIESAEALAYLHESDVIHRDVKTTNILLDDKFRVKVSDFGLSRLFPTDVTHVSTAPQGTPGYVDPEYYQCYQLTDKSDVYSFGVVLVELISSLPAVDTNRHRHDINLANMAINKIQNHALHELVDPSLGFEKDYDVRMMTTSVAELAFRCLQREREMRPSMDEVVEVLRGIKNEEIGVQKAEVVDISADDVGLLKNIPPPLSPDSSVKRASSSTTPNSF